MKRSIPLNTAPPGFRVSFPRAGSDASSIILSVHATRLRHGPLRFASVAGVPERLSASTPRNDNSSPPRRPCPPQVQLLTIHANRQQKRSVSVTSSMPASTVHSGSPALPKPQSASSSRLIARPSDPPRYCKEGGESNLKQHYKRPAPLSVPPQQRHVPRDVRGGREAAVKLPKHRAFYGRAFLSFLFPCPYDESPRP